MTTLFRIKIIALLGAILAMLASMVAIANRRDVERRARADAAAQFQQRVVQKMNQKLPEHIHLP